LLVLLALLLMIPGGCLFGYLLLRSRKLVDNLRRD
jgi:hypothetical protein